MLFLENTRRTDEIRFFTAGDAEVRREKNSVYVTVPRGKFGLD